MQAPTGIYEVNEEKIGRGSTGDVYKIKIGEDQFAEKRIRITKSDSSKKVQRQVEILKKIDHPNIIKYMGFEQTSHEYRIRMELCNGQNLKTFLLSKQYRNQILNVDPVKFATKVCLSIINACSAIKKSMINHRDLKLENIMIQKLKNGEYLIKLIDFGESKFIIGQAQTVVGTLGCMAPEIYYEQPYSQPCDSFSLGITLFEVFQGIRKNYVNQQQICSPFRQFRPISPQQVKNFYEKQIFSGVSLTKGRTPEPFRNIIRGLLHPNPKHRLKLLEVVTILISEFSKLQQHVSQPQHEKEKLNQSLDFCKTYQSNKLKIQQQIKQIQELYCLFVPIDKYLDKKVNLKQLNEFILLLSVIKQINLRIFDLSEKLKFSFQYTLSSVVEIKLNHGQYEKISNRESGIKNAFKIANITFSQIKLSTLQQKSIQDIFGPQKYKDCMILLQRYLK